MIPFSFSIDDLMIHSRNRDARFSGGSLRSLPPVGRHLSNLSWLKNILFEEIRYRLVNSAFKAEIAITFLRPATQLKIHNG